jgi:hypothetical protein
MQLQDLEKYYIEALSLHTLLLQMGFVQDQLVFVPEHLNVGIAIMDGGKLYQFNCCYLEACYRREDVMAGWPHALEFWYEQRLTDKVAPADCDVWNAAYVELVRVRWGLVFDSSIYAHLNPLLAVLAKIGLLDHPREMYLKSIESMKAHVIGCHAKLSL